MHRVRSVLVSALLPVLVVSWLGGAPGGPPPARAAAVTWPTSTLVVSEVQTGGASASDEFVEIANQGAGAGRPGRPRGRVRDVLGIDA